MSSRMRPSLIRRKGEASSRTLSLSPTLHHPLARWSMRARAALPAVRSPTRAGQRRRGPQQPPGRRLRIRGVAMARIVMETGATPAAPGSWPGRGPKDTSVGAALCAEAISGGCGRLSKRTVGEGSSTRPWEVRTGTGAATSPGLLRRFSGMPKLAAFCRMMAPGDVAHSGEEAAAAPSRAAAGFLTGDAVIFTACSWPSIADLSGIERVSSESATVGR
mmetsp:Transcript_21975/g.62416  ORF Transcript_21975/g.62416 Transcript_21975/m.62416 type:complete len:219 (-) Transcript_21975:248-904(-)